MAERITLEVRIVLKSDTIFGSGFSIPGAEDISVCKDEEGYPYLKGSTMKGLLRESLDNIIEWMGKGKDLGISILGEEGWTGEATQNRVQITDFQLSEQDKERMPEECYTQRAFTSLEEGVAKAGTLRLAECVRKNLILTGELECNQDDIEMIEMALQGIKWIGTLRNRGFGEVKIESNKITKESKRASIDQAGCIHYRMKTETPIIITNYAKSQENSNQTYGYITGNAVRGAIIGRLASEEPDWFQEHKVELLSEKTRFLNAVPTNGTDSRNDNKQQFRDVQKKSRDSEDMAILPSIKGFYEKKDGSMFQSVLVDGELTPGVKRAGLGEFCSIQDNKIKYWSAKTRGAMRIQKNQSTKDEKKVFQTRYISKGQEFDGYILLDVPELAEKITSMMQDTIWIGADRYEGFGKCKVELLEAVREPAWMKEYGYHEQNEISKTLYLLAISPFSMMDNFAHSNGLDEAQLAKMLGIGSVTVKLCSTSVSEYGGFNRTWGCQLPVEQMYDGGSIFKLECSEIPSLERIQEIQRNGLGIRLSEGFGQVLFLNEALFKSIRGKHEMEAQVNTWMKENAKHRIARMNWIMQKDSEDWKGRLSNSQLGSLQTILERCQYKDGDDTEWKQFLQKNEETSSQRKSQYRQVTRLVEDVLKEPLRKTIGIGYDDARIDKIERFRLLIELFNFSRRG